MAALADGRAMGGTARGMAPADVWLSARPKFADQLIPDERVDLWVRGVQLERLGPRGPRTFLGKTTDPYQDFARAHMTVAGGVFRLGVGLGKTLTALGAAFDLADLGQDARCWIVCPVNALGTWKPYLPVLRERFGEVQILSQDNLHKVVEGVRPIGGVLLIDEVHGFGLASSQRTQHAHRLRRAFDSCLCLTGTLTHGGVEKALSVLDLATPGQALFATKWGAGEYFQCLQKGQHGTALLKPVGKAKELFMEYLARACISLTKHSPLVRSSVTIPEQELMSVEIGGDMGRSIDELAAEAALAILAETGELPHASAVAHHLIRAGAPEKISWVLDRLAEDDEPLVMFAHYTDTMDAADAALTAAKISFVRVDGETTGDARAEARRAFQAGEVRVFLGQLTAAGVAADLFRARVSVAVDINWKGKDYAQALGRTCRRGQTDTCLHIDLVSNKLQARLVAIVRADEDFDVATAEYQDIKNALVHAQFRQESASSPQVERTYS
jgi:hypothetical protein